MSRGFGGIYYAEKCSTARLNLEVGVRGEHGGDPDSTDESKDALRLAQKHAKEHNRKQLIKFFGRFEMAESNRRKFPRETTDGDLQAILTQDDFEGPEDSGDPIPAKMLNQSDNGLYIEIDRDLPPGARLRIKKILQEESCLEEVCYIRDGLVIRCEVLDEAASHFGVGVKILHKVIHASILTSRFK